MIETICSEIRRFVRECPENRFPGNGHPYFEEPLVGFAAAADPLFVEYKQIVGEFHQTPQQVMESACGEGVRAATVVCWVLPITREAREANRLENRWPSREWALTRNHGENFNSSLRRHLVAWLEGLGHRTVAPQLAPGWQSFPDTSVGIASSWSERHAAYAAGLGTFSLNDGLITELGIAHRLGSVITELVLPPTPRRYVHYQENCLYCRKGSCGACITRCPVGAISSNGHDKARCYEYVYKAVPGAVGESYGVPQSGCGLCQTGVPCEGGKP
ncbi:MAG: epoxyqueuosine reductase [Geobacter sp.]|nr:epoxyqueuosine reductase [Geobacter sp.]